MAHAHETAPVSVPAEMVAERRAGWIAFTNFVKINCLAIAGILLLLLLVAKVF